MAQAIGTQSVVVTLDVRKNKWLPGYTVYVRNGLDKQKVNLLEFCQQAVALGAGEIVINAIDSDGEMTGHDLEFAGQIRAAISSPFSMLGGAGSSDHMQELIESVGVVGAAAGSLFVFKGHYRAVLINYARPSRLV